MRAATVSALLLLALVATVSSRLIVPNDVNEPDPEDQLLIKAFNKCRQGEYFDLFKAACNQCTKCSGDQFTIRSCSLFDDTECTSCASRKYANSYVWTENCVGYDLVDGIAHKSGRDSEEDSVMANSFNTLRLGPHMRPLVISDPLPVINENPYFWREEEPRTFDLDEILGSEEDSESLELMNEDQLSLEEDDEDVDDEDDIDDIRKYSIEDSYEEDSTEMESVETQADLIKDIARNVQLDDVSESSSEIDESDSSSASESNSVDDSVSGSENSQASDSDSESSEELQEPKMVHVNVIRIEEELMLEESEEDRDFKTFIAFAKRVMIFTGYCCAVLALFFVWQYARSVRKQRILVSHPPELSDDEQKQLIRTIEFLKNKSRRNFKYEPLEEFV